MATLRLWRFALLSRLPLPEEPSERAESLAQRQEAWSELDETDRLGWDCWQPIRGKVYPVNPMSTGKDSLVGLETAAVLWSMRANGVPLSRQLGVWQAIELFHDISCHGAEHHRSLCVEHVMGDGPLADLSCWKCRLYLADALSEEDS